MRESFLIVAAVLLVSPVAADPSAYAAAGHIDQHGKTLPLKGATSRNSCAAYGPGFVKVDGTDTCVRIGGVRQHRGRRLQPLTPFAHDIGGAMNCANPGRSANCFSQRSRCGCSGRVMPSTPSQRRA